MSEISNKAIMISVSLLVTIAITSSIIMVIGYFRDIYKTVDKTDISIRQGLTSFDMYDNTEMTGLELINTYNKYKNDAIVNVYYNNNIIKEEFVLSKEKDDKTKFDFYKRKFSVTCQRIDNGANIFFTDIK